MIKDAESLRQLTGEFLSHLRDVRRLSANTCAAYHRDLTQLINAAEFLSKEKEEGEEDGDFVRVAFESAVKKNLSAATLARRLSAWRMFFNFMEERGESQTNPARTMRAPRGKKRLPKALSPDEAARFFERGGGGSESAGDNPNSNSPDKLKKDFLHRRDSAMFELMYSSALRVGELISLNLGDADIVGGAVRIRIGKGGRGREAPMGGRAAESLNRWLAVRARSAGESPALFINRRGGRLSSRAVQRRIQAWARQAGFERGVTPHQLRHSCASHLLQSSGDLRAVQEMLGHRSVASTEIYTHLDFQALAATYDKSHPRAKRET